ncbi:TPA: hydroxyisourate hydrolase [Pseudomonas aeruginosa]|nr:hydroxyisourate hydrolase [Pseudomonas aeruginosa]HBO3680437.1 hydroxyisourate hydrolase [Pseudomonas aeruginosa]HBO3968442.1 hydroxyisourate hydrolase [Pseudomonas aeruginosa]HCD6622584.1 hydroxyisourate hydrolase [Pseudomonas aeruginosa]HCR1218970.1 hydroxyisourate hydrolase [Pseudomonas aeruginosa]
MNGGISIHVVDIASGRVAEGLAVGLRYRRDGHWETLCEGRIGADGALAELRPLAARCAPGLYEARLAVAAFYRDNGAALPGMPFLDELRYRFGVDDPRQHYHLPFKLTAWGLSCFRGGA